MHDNTVKDNIGMPEGYSPKNPDLIDLTEKASVDVINNIIKNHIVEMESIKYLKLPALRFIGKDVRARGPDAGMQYGNMWAKSSEFMPILDNMLEYASEITDPCALMHHDNMDADQDNMHYIVGRFMKADTPVPEGYDYKDLPESNVAFAIYYGEFSDMISKIYALTRDKILCDEKGIPYPVGYFHAEVYVKDNIPKDGVISKMGYIFSCNKSD